MRLFKYPNYKYSCKLCGKEISGDNEVTALLKGHFHFLIRHKKPLLTPKGFALNLFVFIIGYGLLVPIAIVTWPFWWVHEKITR